ncbi:MAG TPA: hypothetical protein VE913_23800 [Longimicrobium sp.]|nr:hypothetical protein [Longimicrobium sp.]
MAGSLRSGPNPAAVDATRKLNLGNLQDVAETFHGDVVIHSLAGRDIAIAFDGGTARGSADGFVDQVFVLQRSDSPAVVNRRIVDARLSYHRRGLIVADARNVSLGFFLGDLDAAGMRRGMTGDSPPFAETWKGYGLARRTVVTPVALARWDASAASGTMPTR